MYSPAITEREYDRTRAERDARELTPLLTTAAGKAAGVSLRPPQAFVLRELFERHEHGQGVFAALTVGGGKTLISFLASYVVEAKRPVLVVPEALREKTYREFHNYARHWITPKPPPRLLGYRELTRVENLDLLEKLEPDFLIFDEAHKLKNQDGSATKRFARYIDATGIPVLAMTGTTGRLSICDFSHLLTWALKESAPVPLAYDELELWANALDERPPTFGRRLRPGALTRLADLDDTAGMSELGIARAAFQRRLATTPGCVYPDDDDDCDQPAPRGPAHAGRLGCCRAARDSPRARRARMWIPRRLGSAAARVVVEAAPRLWRLRPRDD
jgi:hypothetical protein